MGWSIPSNTSSRAYPVREREAANRTLESTKTLLRLTWLDAIHLAKQLIPLGSTRFDQLFERQALFGEGCANLVEQVVRDDPLGRDEYPSGRDGNRDEIPAFDPDLLP